MKNFEAQQAISVSELNSLTKEMLETMTFWVEGEVSGLKSMEAQRYYYVYFSLQDPNAKAVLSCAMRREAFLAQDMDLENGQKVTLQGKMTLFTQSGRAAFLVNQMEVAGMGKLAAELEKIKAKLQAEGLLADERKRPLPKFPQRIGVVTATNSDAWADFQRHSIAKYPIIELLVADSFVQGQRAPGSLIKAITQMQDQNIDVLVITRGGGSAEDLAAFNDEQVVRTIAGSKIPTIVAVGHEKDISIADLVADVRASTPTNAGQIITRNYEDVQVKLEHIERQLPQYLYRQLDAYFQKMDDVALGLSRTRQKYQLYPHQLATLSSRLNHQYHRLTDGNQVAVSALQQKLSLSAQTYLRFKTQELSTLKRQLDAVSPLNVLARGYSIVSSNDQIIRNSSQLKAGQSVKVDLAQGSFDGTVSKVRPQKSINTPKEK